MSRSLLGFRDRLAELIGSKLPSEIIRKVGHESATSSNEAVLITTVDEHGYPKTALLSYLDLCLVSSKRLLFAIGDNSSTKWNLLRTRKVGLVMWLGENYGIYYLNGKTKLVKNKLVARPEGHICSAFVLNVGRVTRDYLPEARILSTITYFESTINLEHRALLTELKHISKSI